MRVLVWVRRIIGPLCFLLAAFSVAAAVDAFLLRSDAMAFAASPVCSHAVFEDCRSTIDHVEVLFSAGYRGSSVTATLPDRISWTFPGNGWGVGAEGDASAEFWRQRLTMLRSKNDHDSLVTPDNPILRYDVQWHIAFGASIFTLLLAFVWLASGFVRICDPEETPT